MSQPALSAPPTVARPTRRGFLTASLGAAAGLVAPRSDAAPGAGAREGFREPSRDLALRGGADVIVCGGGPAGTAAALAAARCGARVRLFELQGSLGGVWTSGLLTYIFDFDKPGLTRELAARLDARGARTVVRPSQFVYHPEDMKRLLEELCLDAGVDIHLQCPVAAAYREDRRLAILVTESKSGREAWRAPVFIDATGDGDLGALAGCTFDIGRGGDTCECQPMTLNALVVAKDAALLKDFISFQGGASIHIPAVMKFREELGRAGVETSYGHPTLFQARGNLLTFMINHEYGVRPEDERQLTAATLRARAEVHRVAAALRALGGPWEGFQVVATAEQIGVRDGRRIHGRFRVTRDDLAAGARHEDGVARVTFGVDIHATSREKNDTEPISHGDLKFRPYDIPLRALIARDVDGLLMAGRCISGDFMAHASYRVTGNSVATGEAAGAVAALAAASGKPPHEIAWTDAEAALRKADTRQPQTRGRLEG
jgi:hypothetical protein